MRGCQVRILSNYMYINNPITLEIYEEIMRNLTEIENKSMFRNNPNFF